MPTPIIRSLSVSLTFLWLALAPAGPASAQTTILTLQETRESAVSAFDTGAFAQAEALARALLRRDPRDLVAQIVLIEVASARGDHEAAAEMAAFGYGIAETDGARFTLARLAAREHALLDHGVYAPPSVFEAWFVSVAHDDRAFARIAACVGRLVALIGIPEAGEALEVLEILPADDDFLRCGSALSCKRSLALRGLQQLLAEGVKVGC